MKKIASILAMLLMAIVLSTAMVGCGSVKGTTAFEQMKSQCPMDMGNGLTLTDVEQDGNNAIIIISAPNASKSGLAAAKPALVEFVKSNRGFAKSMQKEQTTFTMRFVCSDGTEDITIHPSDLNSSEVDAIVSTLKAQCPTDMGNGLTLTNAERSGNSAIITLSAPNTPKSRFDNVKSSMLESAKQQPSFVKALKKSQTTLIYRYECSDGTTDITILPSDL